MKDNASSGSTFTLSNGNGNGNSASDPVIIMENGKKNWLEPVKTASTPEKKGRQEGQNGFEAWGGYMEAKKAKLDAQFHKSPAKGGDRGEPYAQIFSGISVYINGYTEPPEPELRAKFVSHGGTFHPYRSSRTTYVIATNLSEASKNIYGSITVKPSWIMDSIVAGKLLSYRDYLLYDLNAENNQRTLSQMLGLKPTVQNGTAINHNQASMRSYKDKEEALGKPGMDTDDDDEKTAVENHQSTSKRVKMATEDGFLEDFFQHSRLHLISDQKKEMQNKIGNLRKSLSENSFSFDLLKEFETECQQVENVGVLQSSEAILMHVDLDCFFVSVGLLTRPHLRGKPSVVTHSTGKGDNSKSDIASASYEARKFGVHNGMWVSEAKKLCPELVVIPYDFDEYRRISESFFDTVSRVTLDIEPCSVDEMVIDSTSVLLKVPGSTPESLAEFLRRKIFEATSCTASVGIGGNRLVAKLATKRAKPDGVYHLKSDEASEFIQGLKVGHIPGIGWSTESKLNERFQVHYCKELLKIPVNELKAEFGEKTAEKMLQACKGIDTAELKYGFERPKSVSVDVNYGIRFTTDDEVSDFMMKLCKELSSRAIRAQASGMSLALKLMVRRKGAGDPKKHGGHGIVDTITRSTRLFQPTNEWNEMYRTLTKVIRLLQIIPSDYRGIGLSLTNLSFDFDKTSNIKKPTQRTLFDMKSSRGRQMLEAAQTRRDHQNDSAPKEPIQPSSGSPASKSPAKLAPIFSPPKPKRRKLDFSNHNQVKSPVRPISLVKNGNEGEIDMDVLRELPLDIAKEIAQQYGITVPEEIEQSNSSSTMNGEPNTKTVNGKHDINRNISRNPYAEIDHIDPSFLSALPDSIRNEVLIQFQEAKGQKGSDKISPTGNSEPQPCSSRQALERDALRSNGTGDPKTIDNLRCNEEMCDEIVYTTPPKLTPNSRTSTSQNRFKSRRDSMKKITPRRLNFLEPPPAQPEPPPRKESEFLEVSDSDDINYEEGPPDKKCADMLKAFWKDPYYKPPFEVDEHPFVELPSLNGVSDVGEVRDNIRLVMATTEDPETADIDALHSYFQTLVDGGHFKQVQLLLRFLCRKYETISDESVWKNIIIDVVTSAQERFLSVYEYELDLELG